MHDASMRARAATPERTLHFRLWWLLPFGAGLLVLAPLCLLVLPTLDPRLFMYPYGASLHLLAAGCCFHIAQKTPGKIRFQWLLLAAQFVLLSLSLWAPTLELGTGLPSRRWSAWLICGFASASFTSLLLSLTAYGVRAARYARLPDTFMTLNLCALNFLTAFSTGPSGFSQNHLQVSFASVLFLLLATEATRRTAQSVAERQFTTTATIYLVCRVAVLFLINIVDNLWLRTPRELPFDLLYGVPQLGCALLALRALRTQPAPRPARSPSPLWASFVPSLVLAASIFLALHINRDYPLLCGVSISISVFCFILRTNLINQSMLREQQELLARTGHLEALASHDVLTGIGNRRWLEETAFKLLQTGPEAPATLLLIDTDRFKWINDTFGHRAGDRLLTAIGRTLLDEMSAIEDACCARIGGDEFAALLPHAGPETGVQVAEQFRKRIEEIPSEDGNCHASVSIGVAMTSGRVSLSSLLELADEALYAAKRKGRNVVEVAQEDAVAFARRGRHSENRLFREAAGT